MEKLDYRAWEDHNRPSQKYLFSEVETKPFMSLRPCRNRLTWYSIPLKKDELILKGSKLLVKPCGIMRDWGYNHYKIFIASIGV